MHHIVHLLSGFQASLIITAHILALTQNMLLTILLTKKHSVMTRVLLRHIHTIDIVLFLVTAPINK
jgi:hypothetical protein